MTTGSKRWWRTVAVATIGGGVLAGAWFGFMRAEAQPEKLPSADLTWSRSSAQPAAPTVAESRPAPEPAPTNGYVTPAGATVLVAPAVPVAPRIPDLGTSPIGLPQIPALPAVEVPPIPAPPKTQPTAPMVPALPALPALPPATAEPPKTLPIAPTVPMLPQPPELAPPLPPLKPADPVRPMLPTKPDSDLKPTIPGITLNPTVPPVAPIAPIFPPPVGGSGREVPGTPVDRAKPPELPFGMTDKFVFPLPTPHPLVPHHRDDTMLHVSTTAAFAFLSGALFAAEQAKAMPPVIPPGALIPVPGTVRADDKADIEKLKKDLEASNKKVEDLEKQVKKLTELLTGKKDELGLPANPNEPGAVADVKAMKDKIAALEKELGELKKQTVLKPPAQDIKPKGIVRVVNEYPVEITMLINDKTYRVAAGSKLEVEVPAGEFTYQLLQSGQPATKSVIKDKEPVTLRIK
ncbi:MAG: hypothetical protein FJ304_24070 [Planctomycetes bacterium]|nr:hypothetical protein [Planctomycetota bacterium]